VLGSPDCVQGFAVSLSASDDELVSAHRRGDAQALSLLVERHLPAVASLARQLMGKRALADDLTQESFLRAIRGLVNFRGGATFRTWLFRIVVNTSRDMGAKYQNNNAKHLSQAFVADVPLIEPEDQTQPGPERVVLQMELEQSISIAMEKLPLDLRTALILTTMHDFSPREVADMAGCSLNTIYWRIHEARKLLRTQLEPWIQ
jgi:RNA polymerase sigma-70 factor, ECF subfamily